MKKHVLPLVIALLAIAGIVCFTLIRNNGNDTDHLIASGTVEATEALLGFQLPGRIARVLVEEGDRVEAGQELAVLDQMELDARLAQAKAQLAAARAALAELEAGARAEEIAQAREALRAATERFNDAQRDLERMQRLYESGAISKEALDKTQLAFDVAEAQRDQAAQQLQLLEAGPRRERVAAQRAAVAQAEAAVKQVEAQLANTVIHAPFNGVVTMRDREPGETVAAGTPVLTVMNVDDRWVRIFIPEDRLGAVRLGQPAVIRSDTWPDREYSGVVSFIASEAEFTPRNVQTTEERVKLVFAVKVRITGDPGSELKPGMPADVRLTAAPG